MVSLTNKLRFEFYFYGTTLARELLGMLIDIGERTFASFTLLCKTYYLRHLEGRISLFENEKHISFELLLDRKCFELESRTEMTTKRVNNLLLH